MGKVIAPLSVLMGVAVWFLLFVIIGIGLGTAFIAGGCVIAAMLIAAAMASTEGGLDAPLTAAGLLLGIATFVILEVVLSVPLWVDVVSGLAVIGLYDIVDTAVRSGRIGPRAEPQAQTQHRFGPTATSDASDGRDRTRRQPVGAH